jgi:branched-chain amino acid transport system substrate-binding protein
MVLGVISLLALALVAAACGGDEEDAGVSTAEPIERSPRTPIVIPADEPITIGVSAALSGPDDALGIDSRDAVVVGVERWKEENGEQIGGHDIEIHAEDDGCSDADITSIAAGHLLRGEDGHRQMPGLVGIIGPMCSAGAAAVIPQYEMAGIVMISGSTTATDLTLAQPSPNFFFRTAYTNASEGALQARYVIGQLDASTAYVIDDGEAYGTDLANAAQAALVSRGRAVTRASVGRGDIDFSDLAVQVSADSPDVVIFEGFNPEGALLYRQLRDAGYDGPFVSGDGVASVSDFIEPLGEQAEGVVFTGCSAELPDEFVADYVDIIGHPPAAPFPGQYADAATILLDALAAVAVEQDDGSLVVDPMELRDAVSKPELLAGLSGAIAFDENGDRIGQGADIGLVMCKVEGGQLVNFRF